MPLHGLKVQKPFQRDRKPIGVYLSREHFRWMFWATDREVFIREGKHMKSDMEKIPLGCEVEVETEGLYLVPDGDFGYHEDKDRVEPDKDFICLQDIPSDRICRIFIERRTDPKKFGGFEEVNCSNCRNDKHGAGAPVCQNCNGLRNWVLDEKWLKSNGC